MAKADEILNKAKNCIENHKNENYFVDTFFCDICNEETYQKIEICKHERDCNEKIECLKCGSHKYGMFGEWWKNEDIT